MEHAAVSRPVRLRHRARVWLTVRSGWLAQRVGGRDYRRRPEWREGWGGAFNGQQFRQRVFVELAMRVPLVAIIETGTFRGTTTGYFRGITDVPVHSFEANPRHYGFARAHLLSLPNVHLHCCDSRRGLAQLASSRVLPAGPVFFYLDAHGFGDLPLADEVDLAFRYWPEAVVMIDDFAVRDDPGYAFDDYGGGQGLTLDYLAANGVLPPGVWFPACAASAETGARRGCVVLARSADVMRRIDTAGTLRRWAGRETTDGHGWPQNTG